MNDLTTEEALSFRNSLSKTKTLKTLNLGGNHQINLDQMALLRRAVGDTINIKT